MCPLTVVIQHHLIVSVWLLVISSGAKVSQIS